MQPTRQFTYLLLSLLLVSCGYSARYQEAKHAIAVADSLDQNEHVLYNDTAALHLAIRTLDNPFGYLFAHNTLGKAHYYMGRHLSLDEQIIQATSNTIAVAISTSRLVKVSEWKITLESPTVLPTISSVNT